MEKELANKYGTRITLYLKDSNIPYREVYRFICRQARTTPNLLMVSGKSNLECRKWATFDIDRGRAEELVAAIATVCLGSTIFYACVGNQSK